MGGSQLAAVQGELQDLQHQFAEYKKVSRMGDGERSKVKEVDSPHGQTEEIRIHILEQELMDEQKQVEQMKDAIDALKIENSTLNANLQKMKSVERKSTDGTNDDDALC